MTEQRLERLRERMDEGGVDAVLVSQPENRRYLSGFTGSAGWLLISREAAHLATDSRYTEQAQGQAPTFQVHEVRGEMRGWLSDLLVQAGALRKVGFESAHVSYATHERLAAIAGEAGLELTPTEDLVEPLRAVKDADEREAILRAIRLADEAMDAVSALMEPGMTERQVAWLIERHMREKGADSVSFDLIVAAGPNGAMAHHRPSDEPIREGVPIVIDIGAKADGYCSDLTRTVVSGQPGDTFKRVYDIVLSAQLTAIATAEPGMTGDAIDALARTVIEQAGYGDQFGHGLGHGVGLAIHEAPRVGRNSQDVVSEGMIFTVEPGIYITGWGGIRIEDIVEFRNGKAVALSAARKLDTVGRKA